ncbi:maleylpyruvate isomerase family mycothiol-dependent enzyme [Isoptericola sp. NPDC057653]|uniref:maleylpyruvate isomerase family mycothiol-dependent enzyme n=1 Tax=Isoptericola sp. NPDC057653 TaxID=3346195 RepID=UPI00369D664B
MFAATTRQRRSMADLLEELDGAQLAAPSLCAGWDVHTVAAHVAEATAPRALGRLLVDLARAGGSVHRANDAAARRAGLRPVGETVALLRERAESRVAPPVTGPRAPLADVLVHEGDMCLPLGLPYAPDGASVRVALEFVTSGRPVGFVPRGRLSGLRLVATDLGWSWGEGAELSGRGVDLLMAACGRAAVLPRLTGAGVPLLTARLGAGPG